MPAVKLMLTEDELAELDRVSGSVPRERWVKSLIQGAIEARNEFGGPCWLGFKGRPRDEPQREGVHHMIPLDE